MNFRFRCYEWEIRSGNWTTSGSNISRRKTPPTASPTSCWPPDWSVPPTCRRWPPASVNWWRIRPRPGCWPSGFAPDSALPIYPTRRICWDSRNLVLRIENDDDSFLYIKIINHSSLRATSFIHSIIINLRKRKRSSVPNLLHTSYIHTCVNTESREWIILTLLKVNK